MAEAQHTAGLWEHENRVGRISGAQFDRYYVCINAEWSLVAQVFSDTPARAIADAAHIVRCVNSHDALVEACKHIRKIADAIATWGGELDDPTRDALANIANRAEIAIAKATT